MNSFKSKFNKFFTLSFLILGLYSCSNNSDIITNELLEKREQLNVSYGSDNSQKYDIYLPAGRSDETTKTFILVHGGAWISGDKSDLNNMVTLLKLNFPKTAIVNINYRLASISKSPFPMQINDLEQVVSHLKLNANTYQISEQLAFIGTSAGAHLSMLYAYKYDTTMDVKMVCSIVGPTNFLDPSYANDPNYANFIPAIQAVTGINYFDDPNYYQELSPLYVVTEIAPPTILFYGGQDGLIPTSQGLDMDLKLTSLNVPHEFTLYENEGHGWQGENSIDTSTKLINFIINHF